MHYKYGVVPVNSLWANIDVAAGRVSKKLSNQNTEMLCISEYNKKYFTSYSNNLTNVLQRFSYLLFSALKNCQHNINDIILLEYGGGIGILSLLAKELGIGCVIYNDIYDVSCNDAAVIAEKMELTADYYICGDVDNVIRFLKDKNINCDVVVSNDVIEHIYNIENFFYKLPEFSQQQLCFALASGANALNPRTRKELSKVQVKAELQGKPAEYGQKERDNTKAYYKIREEIIATYVNKLSVKLPLDVIEILTKNTRGMYVPDINRCIDQYVNQGLIPPEPKHPTDTCDPYTGNWAEHQLNPHALADVLVSAGFQPEVVKGYYGYSSNLVKRQVGRGLNRAISILFNNGIKLSPYFILCGQKRDF